MATYLVKKTLIYKRVYNEGRDSTKLFSLKYIENCRKVSPTQFTCTADIDKTRQVRHKSQPIGSFKAYGTCTVCYSVPVGVRSIVINPSVCLCVCLSARISLEPLDRSLLNFVCRSPVAVARSSSGGVAICYVLPVLWTTSRLAVVGCMAIAAL